MKKKLYLPMIDGCYHLSGCRCSDKKKRNDFRSAKEITLVFFVLVPRFEALSILVCTAAHRYVDYPLPEKKKPLELLHLKEVAILVFSVFMGHGHLPHGRCGLRGYQFLRSHIYLISASYSQSDVAAITYGTIFCRTKKILQEIQRK